jgi:hypothetical protein
MVTNHATPVLGLFAMHAFVPFPQFFYVLKHIVNVCTKFPWYFFLILIAIDACAFNCMSHFIYQSLHSFTQVATQNLYKECHFYEKAALLQTDHDHS